MIPHPKTHSFRNPHLVKINLALACFLFISLLLSCSDDATSSSPSSSPSPSGPPAKYTVTFNSKGGSTVEPQTIEEGTTARIPSTPSHGSKRFGGWYTDETFSTLFLFTTPINSNITLYARWRTSVILTFDSKGGTTVASQTNIQGFIPQQPPTPSLSGKGFGGWYTDEAFSSLFLFTTPINNNITLYAKWGFTVTFDSKGGSDISEQIILPGATAQNHIPTLNGKRFGGWYTDEAFSSPFDFASLINNNITLYAKWGFTVTFDSKGGSDVSEQIILPGATAQNPTPTYSSNIFRGWYTNIATTTSFDFTSPINNHLTLYAKWELRPANKQELIGLINPAISANPNANLNHINTSLITDMSRLFQYKTRFNGDISSWNTSQVTNMGEMFEEASAFNQNINNWNTSQVVNMYEMFRYATNFNQPIGNWNTSQVTSMYGMFELATSFNQNITNWNTARVTNMAKMFRFGVFNQDIGGWNTSQVTDMHEMFNLAIAFDQDLDRWDTSKATNKDEMFKRSPMENKPPSWCGSSCQ